MLSGLVPFLVTLRNRSTRPPRYPFEGGRSDLRLRSGSDFGLAISLNWTAPIDIGPPREPARLVNPPLIHPPRSVGVSARCAWPWAFCPPRVTLAFPRSLLGAAFGRTLPVFHDVEALHRRDSGGFREKISRQNIFGPHLVINGRPKPLKSLVI